MERESVNEGTVCTAADDSLPWRWEFFISYVQAETKPEVLQLFHNLGGKEGMVWLDIYMNDKGEGAMQEGVQKSKIFLMVLSDTYFERPFCVKEALWALQYQKPILTVHTRAAKTLLGRLFKRAEEQGLPGLGSREAIELNVDDPELLQVTIRKIKREEGKLLGVPDPILEEHSVIDAGLMELLTKWGLKLEADRISGLGVREASDMEYITEDDIDSLGLLPVATRKFKAKLRVLKEAIAKQLVEADLSGESTDEAGSESESESESECASPQSASGVHVIAAYSPDNLDQFRASVSKVVVVVREVAVEWLGSEGGGHESRHPFCATILLDILRHTRFKQNKDIDLANEWFERCVQGNMRLSGDVLEGFQSVVERGSLPTELLRAEASSGNAKQHRRCVALIDAAVRLLHQQSPWGDVAEWNRDVVDGWFTTSEGTVSFLDKAEAYLRRCAEPEKHNLKVMEDAVETGSFVAFFLADRFTQMLVFAVAEYRRARASSMAQRSGVDAEMDTDARSKEDGTLGGFCFLASSTGRACDLRKGKTRCQLRCSPAVVAMLQFMASLPLSQSMFMLRGGEAGERLSLSGAHTDEDDLTQGSPGQTSLAAQAAQAVEDSNVGPQMPVQAGDAPQGCLERCKRAQKWVFGEEKNLALMKVVAGLEVTLLGSVQQGSLKSRLDVIDEHLGFGPK